MVKNNEFNFSAYIGLYSFYRLLPFFEYIYIFHFLLILFNSMYINKFKLLKEDILFYFIALSFILFDILIYDLNYYGKKQLPYILMALFGFFLATKIKNIKLVYKYTYIFLTIDFFSRFLSTQILKWEDNYMSYSYAILLPTTFFIIAYFEERKKKDLLLSIFGIQQIFMYGARGTLISLVISIFFLKGFYLTKIEKKNKTIVLIGFGGLLYLFYKDILRILHHYLPNVRTINTFYMKFVTGELNNHIYGFSSGRYKLYDKGIEEILNNPIKGHGFFGFKLETGEYFYIHNIFLEILHQYGILFFILIIILTLISIKKYYSHNKNVRKIAFLLFLQTITKLLVTGSYLATPYFWIYYGIIFNKRLLNRNNRRKNENKIV
ncbi:MAG: O-antigen ligase family protein [Cetobacterium sp.]